MHTEMSVANYRKYQEMRIDALNHGLRDLPVDRVRFHVCWGSYHGPHKYDIPLNDIVGLILKVKAGAYSIEASNPCHDHEWRVWQETKLPDGTILIPGVIGHYSDLSSTRKQSPIAWCATPRSSGGKTSSLAPTAGLVRESVIRKSVGRNFRQWPKEHASRPKNCGEGNYSQVSNRVISEFNRRF